MRVTMTFASDRTRRRRLARLLGDQRGTTAIEYALIGALIAVVVIGALQALGSGTTGLFGTLEAIAAAVQGALPG
jgi:pilus assembly protein Flp/PilA